MSGYKLSCMAHNFFSRISLAKNAKVAKEPQKRGEGPFFYSSLFSLRFLCDLCVLCERNVFLTRVIYLLCMTKNAVAQQIVDVAYRLHSKLGPGLFESIYEAILASELEKRGLQVATQHPVPVVYEGTRFEMGFRVDLMVEDKVIVEIKSISEVVAIHKKQLLSYLRLSDKRLGLLINFNVTLIKDGIIRIANGLEE